ncbi:long-chain fatty acid transporter FadL [Pectobacterium brasiliense]|uniref:long-chain fatty acid transporter FadL n=1 Tax=Pectobacterium TaxID=122277 RepID=UPI00057C807E|nr:MULTISPECIES: long-chain fatty acid transporter FadL [Pectobacterium]KHS76401.1 long-chain fatty acid outer membrane transporter [Pectobacterium brasiliense]KHT09923.1 long-chain fatty acid outer membrane transporter [Pectobacterium brasiliense]KHT12996.1 long-chain fatty acid outer membrane transporter [Pectobacterium brasiliense]KHT21183.1 long-chain fatty acid outer membrane transporter [Pectobacterium brasiliense]MBN3133824.1 long-chain fatty acid transporter FadL [Pectobacterium brasil
MNQKNLFKQSTIAVAVALFSANVSAAGFQLNEYSSSGLGRAFSGEGAVADNATSGSRNPATMTMFDRPSFSGGVTYINPDIDVQGKNSLTGQNTSAKNIAPHAWVPNLHFIMPLNEQWAVGASATTNYGLATEFNDNYAAGSIGGQTDLLTSNLNLSAAYRLNQHFSFGLGVNAVYADAKIVRRAGELANVPTAAGGLQGVVASPSSEIARLEGKEWGYGWNAGILYEVDENNRFGLTYRSKVDIDFNGDYSNNLPTAVTALNGTGGATIPGKLTLNLPEMWEASAYHRVAPKWAVHYSLTYTSWSQFQELKATGSNGNTLFHKDESFRDAYRIALGTTYYHDDNWTFRGGIAFDDSPVPADKRSISIPDQDRFWLSAGTTYAFNKDASVDVGVSYMHGKQVDISEPISDRAGSPSYTFSSKGKAWLYGVNFNYAF